ncbi:hypothetical protein D5125_06600 [Magnetovirga frankeli]|uniref:hypothetical protein n=1 Tax=Magnetovirga frankeli TaxID=947516 RepID=UPI00129326D1|nr:hypothetical protein D5125_06600 [gamma proteobacterium SS-5]
MFSTLSSHSDLFTALINSLLLLLGAGLGALVLGAALAWLALMQGLAGKGWLQHLPLLPLAMPPVVLAWALELQLAPLAPAEPLLDVLPGGAGMALIKAILVYALTLYPLIYLPLLLAARQQGPAMTEVLGMTDLSLTDYLRRISLPLARYPLFAGLLLVLLLVLSDYPSQRLLRLDSLSAQAVQLWVRHGRLGPILPHLGLLLLLGLALTWLLRHLRGPAPPPQRLHPLRGGLPSRSGALLALWGLGLFPVAIAIMLPLWTALSHLDHLGAARLDPASLSHSLILAGLALGFGLLGRLLGLRPGAASGGVLAELLRHGPVLVPGLLLAALLQALPALPGMGLGALALAAWLIGLGPGLTLAMTQQPALWYIRSQAYALSRACALPLWRGLLPFRPYLLRRWLPGLLLVFLLGLRELQLSYLLLPEDWQTLALSFYPAALQQPAQVALPALLLLLPGLLGLPLVVLHQRQFYRHPHALGRAAGEAGRQSQAYRDLITHKSQPME